MRLVFAGTPAVAVPSLRALAAGPHEIAAVVTRSDAPLGRKRVLTPSPVALAAEELGIPTIKTDRLDAEATARIAALAPELGVIVAYGGLVREPLLSAPAHGWINLHFSLLPRWRGAAPVQRALIAGDRETGASVFQLVAELDAGDVFAEERYAVPWNATAGDVLDALAEVGAPLLARVVDGIADGSAVATPQAGEPTLAPKLTLDDGALDFSSDAETLRARIAGVTPEPGAHTTVDGARFKVLRAGASTADPIPPGRVVASGREILVGTATSPLRLETVQPAGKGAMPAGDWFRGLRVENPVLGS
ncbi:MAG: methionyl-tRNA formyltransferase [Microbacterium sp. 71-36]|uniref:methionyl-tRNA formyltransferase n=1 Tax=unclassified Microbacterium TaxID=2609290 RepID=UPI00086ED409|nr:MULTISPECIES: methionyl-tRNA formyltransferase [unclassified Microbacterium]MBN9211038.1 methionyl-tRNA formyltransferase [Microbacterium sp.]ODT36436.1 MAG: methionyl-tRNA formyltransferase [Microbacterium sp. SCN 71-17]OJV76902.1 MAG: methionyl-tRNA formyltransferase [Microbacterium sp. 71-36]